MSTDKIKEEVEIIEGVNVDKCSRLLSLSTLIAKSSISSKQKMLAQNYLVIRRIFGCPSVPFKITRQEEEFLNKFGFNTLEATSFSQMDKELGILLRLTNSNSEADCLFADELFEIRIKELKYLYASNYFPPNEEIYDGWRALEKYIEYIGR